MTKASEYQPAPIKGNIVVVDYVLSDIRERAEAGKEKYGTYLETNNGRSPLWDAYQEVLDLAMYLRQAILEQEAGITENKETSRFEGSPFFTGMHIGQEIKNSFCNCSTSVAITTAGVCVGCGKLVA